MNCYNQIQQRASREKKVWGVTRKKGTKEAGTRKDGENGEIFSE